MKNCIEPYNTIHEHTKLKWTVKVTLIPFMTIHGRTNAYKAIQDKTLPDYTGLGKITTGP